MLKVKEVDGWFQDIGWGQKVEDRKPRVRGWRLKAEEAGWLGLEVEEAGLEGVITAAFPETFHFLELRYK